MLICGPSLFLTGRVTSTSSLSQSLCWMIQRGWFDQPRGWARSQIWYLFIWQARILQLAIDEPYEKINSWMTKVYCNAIAQDATSMSNKTMIFFTTQTAKLPKPVLLTTMALTLLFSRLVGHHWYCTNLKSVSKQS